MALPKVGVELVAEGASKFARDVDQSEEAISKLAKTAEKSGSSLDKLSKDADKAESSTSKLGKDAGGAGEVLGNLALKAGGAAAGLSLAFGVKSVEAFSSFEAAVNQTKAVTEGFSDEIQAQFEDVALTLGKDLPISATDAATGMGELAKAGVQLNDVIDAAPALATLAVAGNLDMAKSAEVLAEGLNGFGLSGKDANRVVDLLAQTANASAADITDLGETFKYVAPVAKSAGFSIEDMSVAMGLMANAGIKGSEAGTALRSVISRLADPPKDAAEALNRLGLSAFDAYGKAKPFREILVELREKFQGLSQQAKIDLAKGIAGQEAFAGLLAMVDVGDDKFNQMTQAIDGSSGAAKRMADVMGGGLQGQVEQLGGSVETLEIKLGKTLAPAIDKVVGGLAGFVDGATPVVEFLANRFVGGLETVRAVFWDKVIPAFQGFNAFLQDKVKPTVEIIANVVGVVLRTAFDSLVWVVKTAGDVITGTVKVVGSTIEIISTAIKGAIDKVVAVWDGLVEGIKRGAGAVDKILKGDLAGAWEALTTDSGAAAAAMDADFNKIIKKAADLATAGPGLAGYGESVDRAAGKTRDLATASEQATQKLPPMAQALNEVNAETVLTKGELTQLNDQIARLKTLTDEAAAAMNENKKAMADLDTIVGGAAPKVQELWSQWKELNAQNQAGIGNHRDLTARANELKQQMINLDPALANITKAYGFNEAQLKLNTKAWQDNVIASSLTKQEYGSLKTVVDETTTSTGRMKAAAEMTTPAIDTAGLSASTTATKFSDLKGKITEYNAIDVVSKTTRSNVDDAVAAWGRAVDAIWRYNNTPVYNKSAPVPVAYAKGTKSHPGGPALVGEEGPEFVERPGSHFAQLIARPTLFPNLEAGTKIISADQTSQMLSNQHDPMTRPAASASQIYNSAATSNAYSYSTTNQYNLSVASTRSTESVAMDFWQMYARS